MGGINSVDAGLMNKRLESDEAQNEAAMELREARREEQVSPNAVSLAGGSTTRQAQASAKNKKKEEEGPKKESAKPASKMNQASAKLLKTAWFNIPTVYSSLPALLYINLHVFGRSILGEKVFCELGEEWIPQNLRSSLGSKSVKSKIKKIGLLEKLGLIILDFIVFFSLIIIFTIFVCIIAFLSKSWWEKGIFLFEMFFS